MGIGITYISGHRNVRIYKVEDKLNDDTVKVNNFLCGVQFRGKKFSKNIEFFFSVVFRMFGLSPLR